MPQQLSRSHVKYAQRLFLAPEPEYSWEQIVRGVRVIYPDGVRPDVRRAIGTNTFRQKGSAGVKAIYEDFFAAEKVQLLASIRAVKDRTTWHSLANDVRDSILELLRPVRTPANLLDSYGWSRKPVDLYFMKLVAMAKELRDCRERLVPMLFLPLDGQMFQRFPFEDQELYDVGLSRDSTFGNVKTEATYLELQKVVSRRARQQSDEMGCELHPIYFDILWRDRREILGGNLFSASPARKK